MAVASKSARNLVVDGIRYRWRATGNDEWISLVVWREGVKSARFSGHFDYHPTLVPAADGSVRTIGQVVVTNRIVRRAVEYAIRERGYDPQSLEAGELNLGRLDEHIDLSDAIRGR